MVKVYSSIICKSFTNTNHLVTFQLKNDGENPEFLVDGWNAWFYDDIKNLVSYII